MKKTILVAGATGKLGGKIVDALLERDATVRAVVRPGSKAEKISALETRGVEIFEADMTRVEALVNACAGVACVVSALAGLRAVIVDTQKVLLAAAVRAGVPRFIPSDFSTDFTQLSAGANRNFDLRREFQTFLDQAQIAPTSVFNGAFAEILRYNVPLLDIRKKTVGYWGDNPDWRMDFTTMDDTAKFTAATALDDSTPRALRIAGFQISPNELAKISGFELVALGSLDALAAQIQTARVADPDSENELYPSWQNGQYMHDMFATHHAALDNNRYPGLNWTSAPEFIKSIVPEIKS